MCLFLCADDKPNRYFTETTKAHRFPASKNNSRFDLFSPSKKCLHQHQARPVELLGNGSWKSIICHVPVTNGECQENENISEQEVVVRIVHHWRTQWWDVLRFMLSAFVWYMLSLKIADFYPTVSRWLTTPYQENLTRIEKSLEYLTSWISWGL